MFGVNRNHTVGIRVRCVGANTSHVVGIRVKCVGANTFHPVGIRVKCVGEYTSHAVGIRVNLNVCSLVQLVALAQDKSLRFYSVLTGWKLLLCTCYFNIGYSKGSCVPVPVTLT